MVGREDLQLAVRLGFFLLRDERVEGARLEGRLLRYNHRLPDAERKTHVCRVLRDSTPKIDAFDPLRV